jgi:hypothetical protein
MKDRAMDNLHEAGPTRVFFHTASLALEKAAHMNRTFRRRQGREALRILRIDSTSFSLQGRRLERLRGPLRKGPLPHGRRPRPDGGHRLSREGTPKKRRQARRAGPPDLLRVHLNEEAVKAALLTKGLFVVASNAPEADNLSALIMVHTYKAQGHTVEGGMRFLIFTRSCSKVNFIKMELN